jgi:hypothetical protein
LSLAIRILHDVGSRPVAKIATEPDETVFHPNDSFSPGRCKFFERAAQNGSLNRS